MINSIVLQNFRNYPRMSFNFASGINLIVGNNAAGKTNLLEAIYLLATGKSFRVKSVEREMIGYGEEIARVKGAVPGKELEIVLTTGEVQGEKAGKKKCLVAGVAKRVTDYLGNFRAVYFGPEDLELVTDSPSLRRRYLDLVLSQVDREYSRCSLSYEKGLRARNKVLERTREDGGLVSPELKRKLYFWDQLLIKNGNLLTRKRQEYLNYLNSRPGTGFRAYYSIRYDLSSISEARLAQYEQEEVAAAATLVGPHRDDFVVQSNQPEPRDLAVYGSRGEQRLSILWLKMGELAYIESKTDEQPVLLLDDIFSELDQQHRELVFGLIGQQQTIVTTADQTVAQKLERRAQQLNTILIDQ